MDTARICGLVPVGVYMDNLDPQLGNSKMKSLYDCIENGSSGDRGYSRLFLWANGERDSLPKSLAGAGFDLNRPSGRPGPQG